MKKVTGKLMLKPVLLGLTVGLGVGVIVWLEVEKVLGGWVAVGGHNTFLLYRILRTSIIAGAVLGGIFSVLTDVLLMKKDEVKGWPMIGNMVKILVSVLCAMCVSMTASHYFGLMEFAFRPMAYLCGMPPFAVFSLGLLILLIPLFLWVSEHAEQMILVRHAWHRVAMCIAWGVVAVSGSFGMRHLDSLLLASLRAKRMQLEEEPEDISRVSIA